MFTEPTLSWQPQLVKGLTRCKSFFPKTLPLPQNSWVTEGPIVGVDRLGPARPPGTRPPLAGLAGSSPHPTEEHQRCPHKRRRPSVARTRRIEDTARVRGPAVRGRVAQFPTQAGARVWPQRALSESSRAAQSPSRPVAQSPSRPVAPEGGGREGLGSDGGVFAAVACLPPGFSNKIILPYYRLSRAWSRNSTTPRCRRAVRILKVLRASTKSVIHAW